jgi:hypothetical protein
VCESVPACELHPAFLRTPLWKVISMLKFLVWCLLLVACWPLALMALVLYPLVWLILLPFRIVGIAVGSVLAAVWALVILPARILRSIG